MGSQSLKRWVQALAVKARPALVVAALSSPVVARGDLKTGDVVVGVHNGTYYIYDNSGNFLESISDGLGGVTTGCAFLPYADRLYTTNFQASTVVVYDGNDSHAIVQTISTATNGGVQSESLDFDSSGNLYVGHAGNPGQTGLADAVHVYGPGGNLIAIHDVAEEDRGSDWIDLAADQRTLFYTSEGRRILRYDLATGTQLPDFAVLPGPGLAYALRLLPPYDGSGGLIVADTYNVKRLDGAGNLVQVFDGVCYEDFWFALNLDPNGTSFWAASVDTGAFYRFNLQSGALEVGPIVAAAPNMVWGLCVVGPLNPPAGGGGGGGSSWVALYCTAKTNSAGCVPVVSYSGWPSLSSGSAFTVTATNELDNKFGLFFYGINGPAAAPFQGGFLCVKAPIQRTGVQNSGGTAPCGGTYAVDFNAWMAANPGGGPAHGVPFYAGQQINGQFWSRDPGFAPPDNTNLTQAIEFVIGF